MNVNLTQNTISIAYLACPFSHIDPEIRKKRHLIVNQVAWEMHQKGKLIYSPLTHNIPLENLSKIPTGWRTWEKFDKAMLQYYSCLDNVIVMTGNVK